MKILIAEDDERMSKILKIYLQKEGYFIDIVHNGLDAIAYFNDHQVDLLILDWMMPKQDGISVCKELRSLQVPVKIIMLTAKTTTNDELEALSIGADEYIRKPFDISILLIRIKKLFHMEHVLYCKEISLNPTTQEVLLHHKPITLTKKEYDLLKYFMTNTNIVLSREKLLDYIWGMDYFGDIRTVDTHIRRLRKKLGDQYIKTSFGSGYIMEDKHE